MSKGSGPKHLLFYDGQCGLCDRAVQFVYRIDKKKLFAFAPLDGETAIKALKNLSPEIRYADSIILIENFLSSSPKVFILSKAAFRIAWLIGWPWICIGWLSFLPGWCFDWAYSLVAANRKHFFPNDQCFIPPKSEKDRFLS